MVISYNFCPDHFQSYIYRDREKSAWKFGGLTLPVCPSAARVVLCLPLAQQIQSQMYLTTVSGIGGVFFHEDTRWIFTFWLIFYFSFTYSGFSTPYWFTIVPVSQVHTSTPLSGVSNSQATLWVLFWLGLDTNIWCQKCWLWQNCALKKISCEKNTNLLPSITQG